MDPSLPETMKAAAIDRFGGPEVIQIETLPVPKPRADEILIRVDTAGIGVWDPYEREGEFAEGKTRFPHVLGSDGAGSVVAVGSRVRRFHAGDRVYACGLGGGFYAEFTAVKEDNAVPIPAGLPPDEAGALAMDGITALRGLDDQLHLGAGQTLIVFGASGGIGHLAVQLAKRMGAKVLAIASGSDGVALVTRLGADAAVDGHRDDVVEAARDFAPGGIDAALVLTGASDLDEVLRSAMRRGGRIAYPNGVEPAPHAPDRVALLPYDGEPGEEKLEELNRLIAAGPFHVELGAVYPLEEAARAHRELGKHHLGKLALRIH